MVPVNAVALWVHLLQSQAFSETNHWVNLNFDEEMINKFLPKKITPILMILKPMYATWSILIIVQ